ncbi:hypothetical protein [Agrobacterium tumefaciens]|uniref:hypothetical protein n=1 Tax=Agrobacterium tumefaciens TaxID=358 RepID=UPI0015722DC7|nr:hypothetical protein [Agrobacterium tumefaciens]WCJ62810.1 hypothetical protein G6M15_00990 [Agrobacterium tumefaciens]
MGTTKLMIEDSDVRQMAYKAEKEGFGKSISIYADQKETGLRLQMQGKTAAWVVRFRDASVNIGYVYPENDRRLTALSKVRELARAVRSMLGDGKTVDQVKAFLAVYYGNSKGKGDVRKAAAELVEREEAARKAAEEEASRPTTWTLRQCVEQTIADKTDPACREKDRITANTVKDYRLTFNRPAYAHLMDKPVVSITRGEIEAVRNEIKNTVGKTPAGAMKAVIYFRAVMTWCGKNHWENSGIVGDKWWELINASYEIKARDRKPEIEAIVKTLILAEEYLDKPLPGRAQMTPSVGYAALAGLWWIVLTCQRANAGLSLLAHDVVDDKEEGWKLAAWAKDVMKAGKSHALPIPSDAWAIVDRLRSKAKHAASGHEWAFPSETKGGEVHVTASGVYRILYRLAGRDKPTPNKDYIPKIPAEGEKVRKKRDEVPRPIRPRTEMRNLLEEAGIPWWSLHDCRRALTTALNEAGLPGGASVILAHEIDEKEALAVTATDKQRADFVRQRQAKVTAMAYGGAQHLNLKKEGMRLWCDTILNEYARQQGLKTAGGEVGSEAA